MGFDIPELEEAAYLVLEEEQSGNQSDAKGDQISVENDDYEAHNVKFKSGTVEHKDVASSSKKPLPKRPLIEELPDQAGLEVVAHEVAPSPQVPMQQCIELLQQATIED